MPLAPLLVRSACMLCFVFKTRTAVCTPCAEAPPQATRPHSFSASICCSQIDPESSIVNKTDETTQAYAHHPAERPRAVAPPQAEREHQHVCRFAHAHTLIVVDHRDVLRRQC